MIVHMLKGRDATGLTARCGHVAPANGPKETLADVGYTSREHSVTCPPCTLRPKT